MSHNSPGNGTELAHDLALLRAQLHTEREGRKQDREREDSFIRASAIAARAIRDNGAVTRPQIDALASALMSGEALALLAWADQRQGVKP